MKNIVSKIIFLILVIVLIVLIIIVLASKQNDMTKLIYEEICNKNKYTFSLTKQDTDIKYSLKITKLNDNVNIDSNEENEKTSTLVKDGMAYYILHNEKEYYEYESEEIEVDILRSAFENVIKQDYTNGRERIGNKEYYYEEYNGVTDFFLMSTHNEFEENIIKTRFYYDKKNIVYIKTIISETEQELLKVDFSEDIDETVFEIPNDYAEL